MAKADKTASKIPTFLQNPTFQRRMTMSEKDHCCQKPEHLKDTPGTCTSEQIEICHGDMPDHPCTCKQHESEKAE